MVDCCDTLSGSALWGAEQNDGSASSFARSLARVRAEGNNHIRRTRYQIARHSQHIWLGMQGDVKATSWSSALGHILFLFELYNPLLELGQPHPNGIRVSLESLPLSERNNDRTQPTQTVLRELLRGNVLLEGEGVDAAELSSVSVRRERVICTRGIVSAAIDDRCGSVPNHARRPVNTDLSGEKAPTKTLPALLTALTAPGESAKCKIKCSGAYSFENAIASSRLWVLTIKLFLMACLIISTRGNARA